MSKFKKRLIKIFLVLIITCVLFSVLTSENIIIKKYIKSYLLEDVEPQNYLKSDIILEQSYEPLITEEMLDKISVINPKKYKRAIDFEKKDWHDWDFIKYEASRKGPGEQGVGVNLTDPEDIKLNEKISKIEGLNATISDKISVNRSVPDTRPAKCKEMKYLSHLPNISVVMIFHNEYQSILYRSIHSLINRTPKELLHEIILVNDKSTRSYLYEPLQNYVRTNFNGKVKILNLRERSGLISARMEGARVATGEILVFLDAHIEANVNWLPPLIEPIALDPTVVTTPVVDYFSAKDFSYSSGGSGTRGIFDWKFEYKWLGRQKGLAPEEPGENPMMLGCAFAINREYYWDLGAYDEDLMIWNGENYELSFKAWLCGGKLLEVPCSRIAHTFRNHNEYRKKSGVDFLARNFKRIAEVWLDEYKEFLYKTDPDRYAKADAGDLTKPKLIREKLKCKSFKYYLEKVAPEMAIRYPAIPYPDFAYGSIVSEANPTLCIDTLSRNRQEPMALYTCHSNHQNPGSTQFFNLTWHRNIMRYKTEDCVDAYNVGLFRCHYTSYGNQYWRYHLDTHTLIPGDDNNNKCLTANIVNKTLSVTECTANNLLQKWNWGFTNKTAIENWCIYGVKLEKPCH